VLLLVGEETLLLLLLLLLLELELETFWVSMVVDVVVEEGFVEIPRLRDSFLTVIDISFFSS
jgi:hypothetical protein